MTSIKETFSLNGDGWGTTLPEEEQRKHKEYTLGLNTSYEDDRERQMAMFRKEGGFEKDRTNALNKLKTGFIDDFLPKRPKEAVADIETVINEIKSKYANEIKTLFDKIDTIFDIRFTQYTQKVNELTNRVNELEQQVKELRELTRPGFFGRMFNFLSCTGR